MDIPQNLKYTKTHEWVKQDGDSILVGISDAAQDMLGELVFVGDVKVGEAIAAGDAAGVVESVKAASDIYAPVSGEVVEANQAAADAPESVNADAYATWLFRIKPAAAGACATELGGLLSAEAYAATL